MQGYVLQNIVCEMVAILSQPQCVIEVSLQNYGIYDSNL